MEEEVQKLHLKVSAYKERVTTLTSEYEEKVADLRVELTLMNYNYQEALQRIEELEQLNAVEEKDTPSDED